MLEKAAKWLHALASELSAFSVVAGWCVGVFLGTDSVFVPCSDRDTFVESRRREGLDSMASLTKYSPGLFIGHVKKARHAVDVTPVTSPIRSGVMGDECRT
ncbi:hypothetical protein PR001_g9025 [Phytophthora rubi]|uniref:Uncharacterized protein n=1 Tax=Phytophthora rubi TaxID=129364 RepID=A0A6A3MWH1_9STRA|nr:hypothetical protein PR001_g9025 [Phytophthora rubi]